MSGGLFVASFVFLLGLIMRWGFRNLPQENWQIVCAIPVSKADQGTWRGRNITYYGLIVAWAVVIGSALTTVLAGALGVPTAMTALALFAVFVACGPAAKILALVVERKRHTLTIAGASFTGALVCPLAVMLSNYFVGTVLAKEMPLVPALAAMALGYTVGEGLGRLACISFGCCYGKQLSSCAPWIRLALGSRGVVFRGITKKAAYEGGLEGVEVVPVQALTALVHLVTAAVGILLYLNAFYASSLVVSIGITHTWRVFSETLRADHRGRQNFSDYQIMALVAVAVTLAITMLSTTKSLPEPDILLGLRSLWDPAVILGFQFLWVVIFLFTGPSKVTGSVLSFQVHEDKI